MTSERTLKTWAPATGYQALLDIDQSVLEAIPAAIYVCAADGTIRRFNAQAAELWGRRPAIGDTDERFCGAFRLRELDGHVLPHEQTPMADALQTGASHRGREVVIERQDGSSVVVAVHIHALKDAAGRIEGAINCFQEITDRKQDEANLARSLEEQRALYHFTDRLHRAESLDEVHEAALDAIIQALPCQRASILLFDDRSVMRFVAWRGLSDAYRKATDGHSPWSPETTDPQPLCISDVGAADLPDSLKTTIMGEGIGALAFIPLTTNGKVVGKFMAYHNAPHDFTSREVDVALTIARQVAFSVSRMRAEEARRTAERELRESEARESRKADELKTIMSAVPALIWIARDREGRVIDGNPASFEFLRLAPGANPSLSAPKGERPEHFKVFVDGRELAPDELPVQRAARGEEITNFEQETRFDDGTPRFLFGNATPLRDAAGEPCGAVAAFVDITDRKQAENQRDLLIAELNHRVKNTLATVISIAGQSFSRDRDPLQALESFNARIRALAQTHNQLAEANGAGVSLETLLRDEFAPYRMDDGSNVRISGPPITLSPKCALTLGMTIHELTTNAAKYGALSRQGGSVDVTWRVHFPHRHQLSVNWTESGGPPVKRPNRSGFGCLLVERALTAELGGEVELKFAEKGLRCAISLPFENNVSYAS